MDRLKENTHPNEDGFSPMEVEGTVYTDKKAAGSAILAACKAMTSPEPVPPWASTGALLWTCPLQA